MTYEHFKVVKFYLAINYFKIIIPIKVYDMSWIIFLPLTLIIVKLTPVLKLTTKNVFC